MGFHLYLYLQTQRSARYLTSVYCPCYIFAVRWQRVKTHLSCCPGHLCVIYLFHFILFYFFWQGRCFFPPSMLLSICVVKQCLSNCFSLQVGSPGLMFRTVVAVLKASCLTCCAVFVFPGGWGPQWLHSAVARVVDRLSHSPDRTHKVCSRHRSWEGARL